MLLRHKIKVEKEKSHLKKATIGGPHQKKGSSIFQDIILYQKSLCLCLHGFKYSENVQILRHPCARDLGLQNGIKARKKGRDSTGRVQPLTPKQVTSHKVIFLLIYLSSSILENLWY